MTHDVEGRVLEIEIEILHEERNALRRRQIDDAREIDALQSSIRVAIDALESGAMFDWYQRDALLRRLRRHVEE
jgi:hypothetical protein